EWEVDVTRLGEYTTKKDTDNHGLGLYNVRRAVEEYNGEMKIEATEDMFKISIFIPDKDIFM
ncbi:MAG: GHKL domain-containing protein, partial [Lachnospiraceae bacterium]|nr:GHKL domain-containing protein [Lachnospiraceae bacterium]